MKQWIKRIFQSALLLIGMPLTAAVQFPLDAKYTVDNSWPTGYQVTVTLTNSTSSATNSWNASFSLPQATQHISSFWNGVFTASGQNITVANPTWITGGIIPAGGSTTFGMIVQNPQSGPASLLSLKATANGSAPPPPPPPPVLTAPVLQPIANPSGSSQYSMSWSSVSNAQQYKLQEATHADFSNAQTIFTGTSTSYQASGRSPGTYYYRVAATSGSTISPYSNTQSIVVLSPPPPPLPPAGSATIESYWESWNSTDTIASIVNMHVDIINIAFANFTTTGLHMYAIAGIECDQATLTQLVTTAHNAGKKVKIAIGGATYPISPQLQTTQDALGMAQAIATFVQHNSLDGVDFDIEDYPAPNLQLALLQNTRQFLGNGAHITYTPKSPASTTFPYNAVIQSGHSYVNAINIMAYDYGPGYTYQQDVTNLRAMGVPASKIVIGLMPGYDDLHVMTSIADISAAAQYIKMNGLGGIMFWDLNRDHENLTGLGPDAATNTAWDVFH